ncbi:hypothetical protein M011DRAFT_469692 [Sporormia fimetaria CBS 119925]|uniref:DUF3835 domain-containing protein n=1 Tax=Sporormia fimetaria CBS 119925 TaxID=1340428 RepID=A0A6A6V491_9PLEO|nr:hypothetical protein M011DRAFT_469692 [Sporormia fimetaria CBS 119925]
MATSDQNPLADIERRRAQLEENVTKLRHALEQWYTWELEYEMFKEEIQAADSPSSSQILTIGRNLVTTLLDEKEVEELIGKNPTQRTANQVIDMISRRVDYVQQNISTVEKQLDKAEKQLEGAGLLLNPDVDNEEGLPMFDIQEELDEKGNVVSSSVLQPGKSAPEIVEALRRAGVKTTAKEDTESPKTADEVPPPKPAKPSESKDITKGERRSESAAKSSEADVVASSSPVPTKKSVSFAEDTKPAAPAKELSPLEATGYNEALADYNFTKGTRVIEVDEDDQEIASYPIIPQGESPEDAELRRQMLQYGLSEVGQIVAEMDLDGPAEYSDEDMDDDYDEDTEESELEDEYGRSLRPVITDEYRQKMAELEEKLNARMLENIGPRPDASHPLAEYSDDLRTLKVQKDGDFDESLSKEPSSGESAAKKGVRFTDTLDISPEPQPPQTARDESLLDSKPTTKPAPTISNTIVERTTPTNQPAKPDPPRPAKVSRFKSSRTSAQPGVHVLPSPPVPEPLPVPSGPKGRPIADTVVEHVNSSEPHIPDEFDPVLVNREVQVQYHKMRNKMIQEQGGFKPTQEEEDYPLMEEKNGKPKKVSRFRAARLKADGADGL